MKTLFPTEIRTSLVITKAFFEKFSFNIPFFSVYHIANLETVGEISDMKGDLE